jgi:hypothetical protein
VRAAQRIAPARPGVQRGGLLSGCDPLISWLAVVGSAGLVVGLLFGFLAGGIHALRSAERMIRGGKPRVRL